MKKDLIQIGIIIPSILYILGTWIALDFNPVNWLLFSTAIGRFIFLLLIAGYGALIYRYWSQKGEIIKWRIKPAKKWYEKER